MHPRTLPPPHTHTHSPPPPPHTHTLNPNHWPPPVQAGSNRLEHLRGVEHLACLRRLDIADNCVACLEDVSYARHAPLLSVLNLSGNPLEKVWWACMPYLMSHCSAGTLRNGVVWCACCT